jgi:hypothetical protein
MPAVTPRFEGRGEMFRRLFYDFVFLVAHHAEHGGGGAGPAGVSKARPRLGQRDGSDVRPFASPDRDEQILSDPLRRGIQIIPAFFRPEEDPVQSSCCLQEFPPSTLPRKPLRRRFRGAASLSFFPYNENSKQCKTFSVYNWPCVIYEYLTSLKAAWMALSLTGSHPERRKMPKKKEKGLRP